MAQLLLGLFLALADILRAAWEILLRRSRSSYSASAVIRAPQAAVWDLLERRDVTYASNGTRIVYEPLTGQDGTHVARILVGQRDALTIAFQYLDVTAPDRMVTRYVPALSSVPSTMGLNDDVTFDLRPVDGGTHVTCTRTIEHVRPATRISAPIGVRQALALTRAQAEHEAGIRPAVSGFWSQVAWTVLAFASFAWLLDWRLALALMVIIAIHEAGHALAMLWYGLGVSVVSFVPFLGGVAAPKRPYQTEVQRVVVALMGVAFSLPFSLAAIWLAARYDMPNIAVMALLSIVINGANLVPFPALDGSVVVSILLSKLHKALNLAVTILMFGLFVAIGILVRDPLMWIAIAISFISVVQVMTLKADDHLVHMRRLATAATVLGFAALIAVHVAAFFWASLTAARAETSLMNACIAERGRSIETIRHCREQGRLWFFDKT